MSYLLICLTALFVSGLTLFSGFGLGTLLMPVFALFFPVGVAVAATAVVHLANNIFKAFLVGRQADLRVLLNFALPGSVAAVAGAWLLTSLSQATSLFEYEFAGRLPAGNPGFGSGGRSGVKKASTMYCLWDKGSSRGLHTGN
jgi:hypothetical protein